MCVCTCFCKVEQILRPSACWEMTVKSSMAGGGWQRAACHPAQVLDIWQAKWITFLTQPPRPEKAERFNTSSHVINHSRLNKTNKYECSRSALEGDFAFVCLYASLSACKNALTFPLKSCSQHNRPRVWWVWTALALYFKFMCLQDSLSIDVRCKFHQQTLPLPDNQIRADIRLFKCSCKRYTLLSEI